MGWGGEEFKNTFSKELGKDGSEKIFLNKVPKQLRTRKSSNIMEYTI